MGALWKHLKQMDVPWLLRELFKPTIKTIGTAIAGAVVIAFYLLWNSRENVASFLWEPLPIPAGATVFLVVVASWTAFRLARRRTVATHASKPNGRQGAAEEVSEALTASPPTLAELEEEPAKPEARWYSRFGLDWQLTPRFIEAYDKLEIPRMPVPPGYYVLGPYCSACKRDATASVARSRNYCLMDDCNQQFQIRELPSERRLDWLKKQVLIEAQAALRRGDLDASPGAAEQATRQAESQRAADAKTISDLKQKLEAKPIDPRVILGHERSAIHKGLYVRNQSSLQDAFNIRFREVRGKSWILRADKIGCLEASKNAPLAVRAYSTTEGSMVFGVAGGAMKAFLEELPDAAGVGGFKGVDFSVEIEYEDAEGQRYVARSDVRWRKGLDSLTVKHRGIVRLS